MNSWAIPFLVLLFSIAVVTDFRKRKIYNWLTFPAMITGYAILLAQFGLWPALKFTISLFFLALLLEVFRIWASGDSKLFIAGGLWTGVVLGLPHLFIATGIWGMNLIIYVFVGMFLWFRAYRYRPILFLRSFVLKTGSKPNLPSVPGALPIAAAHVLYIVILWI